MNPPFGLPSRRQTLAVLLMFLALATWKHTASADDQPGKVSVALTNAEALMEKGLSDQFKSVMGPVAKLPISSRAIPSSAVQGGPSLPP